MEEYGTGRYAKKHSTFYKVMMEELGLHTSESAHEPSLYQTVLPCYCCTARCKDAVLSSAAR